MKCAICSVHIENENPHVLTVGAYGTPRCLCDECAGDFDIATGAESFDEISLAVDRISKKMTDSDPDAITVKTVSDILKDAGERAVAIKDGTYDFSLDERESDEPDELPEELREDPEDVLLDEKEAEKNKRFDKIFNIASIVTFAILGIFFIYAILDRFLF